MDVANCLFTILVIIVAVILIACVCMMMRRGSPKESLVPAKTGQELAKLVASGGCQVTPQNVGTPKMGHQCQIDSDCPSDQFCYFGQCWGYWKGYPMPWSTCRNPYCRCVNPGGTEAPCKCASGEQQCLPYCKCQLNRQPGGSSTLDCFPKCGQSCSTNDECPPGCPMCHYGTCQAPTRTV